jgi:predicted ArsR family transcriptional regulator
MEVIRWKDRVLGSTRGRIIALLRRGPRTVNELAHELALTDNAIRTHLAALERDGLAAFAGVRRGIGKPAHLFELTAQAETLFPRAYAVVLRTLLDVMRGAHQPGEVEALVAEVGRRLAEPFARATGEPAERGDAAVAVLAELGGVAEAQVDGRLVTIRGFGCPLREAVDGHPDVCRIAAALLSEVVGHEVTECCDRGDAAPSCRFTFAA